MNEVMNNEMLEDLKEVLLVFDGFLDNAFDRGAFDLQDEGDKEIEDFLLKMKQKYLTREN